MKKEIFNLERFIEAQDEHETYKQALREIADGEKTSHWIWFVFPQIRGLGRSGMAKKYAIQSLYEAYAFVNDNELANRLRNATELMNECNYGRDIENVLGDVDAMKFKSSMTLFDIVEPHSEYDRALRYFYDGERDQKTLAIIADELKSIKDNPFDYLKFRFRDKAYFDEGCHESSEMAEFDRLATFLDLFRRGYSINTLSRQYLVSHNELFADYRTSNLEFTLSLIGSQLQDYLFQSLDKEQDVSRLHKLATLFPYMYFERDETSDWETFSMRLDHLLTFIFADEVLSWYANDLIDQHTTIC